MWFNVKLVTHSKLVIKLQLLDYLFILEVIGLLAIHATCGKSRTLENEGGAELKSSSVE